MKNTTIYLSLIFFAWSAEGQQSNLRGEVSIINSKYETNVRQYVPNAAIEEDLGRSQATTSDVNGIFRLDFIGIGEKERATILVKKEGLEVVNVDALHVITGQKEQVRIYMATPQKIADYKRKYYQIGKTSAEKALEEKIKKLQAERQALLTANTASQNRISELETQIALHESYRIKIDADARELARRYAVLNLDDASPLFQEAFANFQKGELEEALKILRRADLLKQTQNVITERDLIAAARTELAQRDSIQRQRSSEIIQAWRLKADIHKNRLECDSIRTCYNMLLALDSTAVETIRGYAHFLTTQNEHIEASLYYEKALANASSEETKGILLNNLGNAYRASKLPEKARASYAGALEIFRKLTAEDKAKYAAYLALTLNNLGNFFRANRNPYDAEKLFSEALVLYSELASKDWIDFLPYHALTQNYLGRCYYELSRMLDAKNAFEKSLLLYDSVETLNPDAIIPEAIESLYDQTVSYDDDSKRVFIFDDYSETLLTWGLAIHRKMAGKKPELFKPIIGLTLNNLGSYYSRHRNYLEADSVYNEALSLFRELAAKNPDGQLPNLAKTLENLGEYHASRNNYRSSQSFYLEALQVWQSRISKGQTQFLADWDRVAGKLTGIKYLAEREKDYSGLIGLSQTLAKGYDSLREMDKNITHYAVNEYRDLSWWALLTKDYQLAEKAALRSLALDSTQNISVARLGHAYLGQGQYDKAYSEYGKLKGKSKGGQSYKKILLVELNKLKSEGVGQEDMLKIIKWVKTW